MITAVFPSAADRLVFIDQRLADGRVRIYLSETRDITATLSDSQTVTDTITISLGLQYRPGFQTVALSWQDGRAERLMLSGEIIYSSNGDTSVDMVGLSGPPSAPEEDFGEESERCKRKRKQKLDNFARDASRIPGGIDYAFTHLAGEVEQLGDLIGQVRAGKLAHVSGMMSRVRVCLIGPKPLGLLQLCAAYLDARLLVFTSARPNLRPPIRPDAEFVLNVSATPNFLMNNPIDLDAWLPLEGLLYRGKSYSHQTIIREIGNTVASHVDLDIQPSVYFLRSGKTKVELEMDHLSLYSIRVADVVLHLASNLMQIRYGTIFV